jgi:FAD/FMN-containing dehydrogenase/Fe-S oxidoreductase
VDEQQRGRLADDLKGFFKGELHFDRLTRALYSTDASIFQVQPLGVAVPRDEADVQALVRYAGENQLALVGRGAGTGLAGESLGAGLVVDLSQSFREILEVGPDFIRAQPGVTARELNDRLARDGRRFAPDPASAETCTLGGMLATDASGARALKHGYTRDHLRALRVVLDNGDVAEARTVRWAEPAPSEPAHWHEIVATTAAVLEQNADVIASAGPRTAFDRCGYRLRGVLQRDLLHMQKLLAGSEGTLGLFTEATVNTIPLAGGQSLVFLGFASLDDALLAVQKALEQNPSACDLIDRRLLSVAPATETDGLGQRMPAEIEAALLVEFETDRPSEARAAALELADRLTRIERLALQAVPASEPGAIHRLWQVREAALPSLYGLRGKEQAAPFVEDAAVPLDQLSVYLHRVQQILKQHQVTASFLIHAGAGQVHTRPFLDLDRPEDVTRLTDLAEAIHSLTIELGGTISSQHGAGLARTPWIARQVGPLHAVLRQIKAIFDPKGIFNPGKIVGVDRQLPAWPLRGFPPAPADEERRVLRWQHGELRRESGSCNGCGQCRSASDTLRMCPVFHATHAEAAAPRAKANLLRQILMDATDARAIASEEVRAVADLCINCKMCAVECPSRLDIPKMMLEAKAANVAEFGLDRKDWFLANVEAFARWGGAFAPAANYLLSSPTCRWAMEKLIGLSSKRRLPRLAGRSFLRRARRRGWSRKRRGGRPGVAYFVDLFANTFDPQIGEAVVAVLQHNGIDVFVPPEQRSSGMSALAVGDVESARDAAMFNLRAFGGLAREGFTILCSEPTAALMLRRDYLDLTDDPDARVVAERTVEFTAFLRELQREGRLRTDFQALPWTVGHHVPCHLKAIDPAPAAMGLLGLIPELQLRTLDVSCSGMAGTFGLRRENYEMSLKAGKRLIEELQRPNVLFGSTECGACRIQMEHGTGKRTLHPAQYLALAYGLIPAVARRLEEPIKELILR